MSRQRRSFEAGHIRKYLIVVDDSAETDRAIYWSARRAARTNSTLLMLRVIENRDRNQQWLGVADIMRAEAHEAANAALDKASGRANGLAGITPERAIREGDLAQEILSLIDQDEDIGILVLAASAEKDGPGPLVSSLAKTAGTYPIPIAIVPGHLSDEELDAMS